MTSESEQPMWGPLALVRRLWRGEVPMWRVFWLYWFLPLVIFSIYAGALETPLVQEWLVQQFADPGDSGRYVMAGMRFLAFCFFAYMIFIIVAVWKSAVNFNGPRFWSYMVRACMVFYFVSVAARCVGAPTA